MEYNFINWFTPSELLIHGEIMKREDIKHLEFIYTRMNEVFGEDSRNDYMVKFRKIINSESDIYNRPTTDDNDSVSSEISRDNEIKMQIAKDLLISTLRGKRLTAHNKESIINDCCNVADQIFNRFNK